jgi:hypothetical protein
MSERQGRSERKFRADLSDQSGSGVVRRNDKGVSIVGNLFFEIRYFAESETVNHNIGEDAESVIDGLVRWTC